MSSEEELEHRRKAFDAAKSWGWSDADAEDLAGNAWTLYSREEKLKGRVLKEFWDVNPSRLLQAHQAVTQNQIRTRFPPEPNGFAHFGHAKSMAMNFHESFERMDPVPSAEQRHVTFRYDDTNPEVETEEYVQKLGEAVDWMGWKPSLTTFASDYFPKMFELAVQLIKQGDAYVCHQTGEDIERSRKCAEARHKPGFDEASSNVPAPESPWRGTSPEENLKKFMDMKRGLYEEGEVALRMKIDMRHPNPNLWDPVAYRIIYHHHGRSGDEWCIYPTYDFAHCVVDALEHIDYSICTMEFETRRESYYWLLFKLDLFRPKVFEFARFELKKTLMSKRKLKKLVEDKIVRGWDDPRMPTLMGMKRRGYSKDMINAFLKEVGITRNSSSIEVEKFFDVARHQLDVSVPRGFMVLRPVLVELINLPADFSGEIEAPLFPQIAENTEKRRMPISRMCYVDSENVRLEGSDDFYGMAPGKFVRLRYAAIVKCEKIETNSDGSIKSVQCTCWFPEDSPYFQYNSSPLPDVKPKGVLHWISSEPNTQPTTCEARLYDHLIQDEEAGGDEELKINPESEVVLKNAIVERDFIFAMVDRQASGELPRCQMERVGYFCLDLVDSQGKEKIVLNRILPLTSSAPVANKKGKNNDGKKAEGGKPQGRHRTNEERLAQEARKAELLKIPVLEYFKRPEEVEKWEAFDENGIPTREKGSADPLSKSKTKDLKKELEKHRKARTAAGFTD